MINKTEYLGHGICVVWNGCETIFYGDYQRNEDYREYGYSRVEDYIKKHPALLKAYNDFEERIENFKITSDPICTKFNPLTNKIDVYNKKEFISAHNSYPEALEVCEKLNPRKRVTILQVINHLGRALDDCPDTDIDKKIHAIFNELHEKYDDLIAMKI